MFQPFARNKIFDLLFKHDGHLSTSIKNKLHDREMTLVFNNEAKVRIKLTYGLGFWIIHYNQLSEFLTEAIKKPIDFEDVTPELVKQLKCVDLPVFNQKHEKDTTASVWGYMPVDSE